MKYDLLKTLSLIGLSMMLFACGQNDVDVSQKSAAQRYIDGYENSMTSQTRQQVKGNISLDFTQAPSLAEALEQSQLSVDFTGAIDMPQGLVELTSVVPNNGSAKEVLKDFAVLFNLNEHTLVVPAKLFTQDAAGPKQFVVLEWAFILNSLNQQLGLFNDQETMMNLPFAKLWGHLLTASHTSLRQLPETAFKQEPLDALAKSLGAHDQISLTTNPTQNLAFYQHQQTQLRQNIKDDGTIDEGQKTMLMDLLDRWDAFMAASQAETDQEAIGKEQIYLNPKGQFLAYRVDMSLPVSPEESVTFSFWSAHDDVSQPAFTLPASPLPTQTLSLPPEAFGG